MKTMATGSSLWPRNLDGAPMNLDEIPSDFMFVLGHALNILSWQENLAKDEMPPHWMWHLDHELELWFDKVAKKRDAKYGGKSEAINEDEDGEYDSNILYERRLAEMKSP